MSTLYNYSADEVLITLGGILVSGYAAGTFVSVERNEDSFALYTGADGDGTRAKTNNRSGRVTLTLAQSSQSNAALAALLALDERGAAGAGVKPLLVRSGSDIHTARTAWIVKPAMAEYGREVSEREWIIETNELETTTAGG